MLDQHSPDVAMFMRSIEEDIEKKRNALERPQKDMMETSFIRGQIKGYRTVLDKLTTTGDDET